MTPSPLDPHDIQGNVLHGYTSDAATYLFLTVDDAEAARAWLADILPNVQTAAHPPSGPTLNIAISYPGLRALGVADAHLATFPEAFREGMVSRAHSLGDRGANDPEHWSMLFKTPNEMGSAAAQDRIAASARDGHEPHVVVIVTGDGAAVAQQVTELHKGWWQDGLRLLGRIKAHHLDGRREHFGYVDGMSQPGIADGHTDGGEGEGVRDGDGWRALQPGEFILGLPDEDGAPAPLPQPPALSRHGSYLVLRKLEQDVAEFERRLADTAALLDADEALVAAKLMGRWRDGTPITLRRDGPDDALSQDKKANNRFTFDADADGYGCPVGAHIRRANPRGSLGFDGKLERRHRIIRRGIPYDERLDDERADTDQPGGRGLVFVCFQADIERQFEFIQSGWLNDGNVFGLGGDRDPFIGDPGEGTGRMRIEQRRPHPPRFIPTFQDTVTVRGGGYFFLPSISGLDHLSKIHPRNEING